MPQCCFKITGCEEELYLTSYYTERKQFMPFMEAKLFFHSMECSRHHNNFVCKKCNSAFSDIDSLYGHIISCCCGHIGGSTHLKARECRIYETEQIKQMIDVFNGTRHKHITAQNIVLHVSIAHLKEIFPQFVYLQMNVEMFKKMDIGNIDFLDGRIVRNLDCYAILCEVWSINIVVRSIAKEFVRSMAELEFVCSVPGCRMVYNCLPDMNIIIGHVKSHYSSSQKIRRQ